VGIRIYHPVLLLFLTAAVASGQPVLRLKARSFKNRIPATSEFAAAKRRNPVRSHFIVQFAAAPTREQMEILEGRGARILQPVPDFGLLISAPDGLNLQGFGLYQSSLLLPEDKVSPLLRESTPAFLVEFHPDVDSWEARGIVLQEGFEILENPDLLPTQTLVRGSFDQVPRLARWDEVAYIFPASDDLVGGRPVRACAGAVIDLGTVGQYIATIGEGWDGPGAGAAELTYTLERLTDKLPADAVESEIRRALAEWARHARLDFLPGTRPSASRNLNFLFAHGAHGDPFPFDGRGRVLAHTFFPAPPNSEPIAGDLHFDDDENWKIGAATDLFSVVLHELGHALGLGHSDKPGAVMYPYYRVATELTEEDVKTLLELYAARGEEPSPPVAPPAPPVPPADKPPGNDNPPVEPPKPPVTPDSPPATPNDKPDNTAPSLRIISPATNNVLTSAPSIVVQGTTSDNVGVARVSWSTNAGHSGDASGASQWATPAIPLLQGTNIITIRAYDAAGNSSWRSVMVTRR
jgi:hypothetical protein